MKTIALLNRKGGVGKTSCTHHLAGTLAAAGHRVLLVDLDPQASLTQGLLGPGAGISAGGSVAAAFEDLGQPACTVQRPVIFPAGRGRPAVGIHLVPGHAAAADHNAARCEGLLDAQTALRDWLRPLAASFDVCLIDCPPTLQLLSRAALVAADGVVVPLQPEDYGAQGIAAVAAEVAVARALLNPDLKLLGYLLTMVQRNALHAAYSARLRHIHGLAVFSAEVPRATALAESVVARLPIAQYRPHGKPAAAIAAVAEELLRRAGIAPCNEWRAAA